MYRDFYNFIASEASWRGSLLRHNKLEENNTKTLVCKEKSQCGQRNGEVGKISAYGASQSHSCIGKGPDGIN